jgi:hypothetical protein
MFCIVYILWLLNCLVCHLNGLCLIRRAHARELYLRIVLHHSVCVRHIRHPTWCLALRRVISSWSARGANQWDFMAQLVSMKDIQVEDARILSFRARRCQMCFYFTHSTESPTRAGLPRLARPQQGFPIGLRNTMCSCPR